MEAARRSLAFCSGRSRLAADNTNRVRRATCDNPQTRDEKRTQLRRPSPKINIHDGGVEGGGRKEGKVWGTTTKGMINVDGIFYGCVKNNNHQRIDRSGFWNLR